ncbi:hypothetical protein TVAG_602420, partial [Trichomonas vaginalis G3]
SHGHRHRHAPQQQPTIQNPAQQPTVQNPAQQPTVQNPAQQPAQTEQGHKRSREQGNQEFL